MKKPIKVIKRSDNTAPQNTPAAKEICGPRQIERELRTVVNDWIEERRRNGEIQLGIANTRLRKARG